MLLQAQFNSGDPITPEGGIAAGWVLVGAFCLIGALGLFIINNALNTFKKEIENIHKRIDTRENEHDEIKDKHLELNTKVLLIEASHKIHKETQAEEIANVILSKLGAMQGNTVKHAQNPIFNKP